MSGEVRWERRQMRRPGTSVGRNDFVPQPWHIGSAGLGSRSTLCGRNVSRYAGNVITLPPGEVPEGRLCATCLRYQRTGQQRALGGRARVYTPPTSTTSDVGGGLSAAEEEGNP